MYKLYLMVCQQAHPDASSCFMPKKVQCRDSPLNQGHYEHQPLKSSYKKYTHSDEFHFANSNFDELTTDDSVSHTDSTFKNSDGDSVTPYNHKVQAQDQCSIAISKVSRLEIHSFGQLKPLIVWMISFQ